MRCRRHPPTPRAAALSPRHRPCRAYLHLGEPHPARQLAALGGAQVAVPLEGALQGADLLGAERRPQPPAPPARRLFGALGAPLQLGPPRCPRPLACSWGRGRGRKGSARPRTRKGGRSSPPSAEAPTAAVTCSRGCCQALPAPAAFPGAFLLAPLAQAGAGARGRLAARGQGGCSAWGALCGALGGLAALGQPLHGERGLGHPALFRGCREGGCRRARLLYTASPPGKRCLCKYTSKSQISII